MYVLNINNDTNDSNQLIYSTSSKTPPANMKSQVAPTIIFEQKRIIPEEHNSTDFLEALNKAKNEIGPILSSVLMSFQCKVLNYFFICHIWALVYFSGPKGSTEVHKKQNLHL